MKYNARVFVARAQCSQIGLDPSSAFLFLSLDSEIWISYFWVMLYALEGD
jgi:hypothetical protein